MPLDALGRTRATMASTTSVPPPKGVGNLFKASLTGDWGLQLSLMNREFPVGVIHEIAPTESLPFVHTARRYYRLNGLVRALDRHPRKGPSITRLSSLVGTCVCLWGVA